MDLSIPYETVNMLQATWADSEAVSYTETYPSHHLYLDP